MKTLWQFLKRRESVATFFTSTLLIGYISFLLFSFYNSQMGLQQSSIRRLRYEIEKRAASLDYFFSERKNDLRTLITSREILAFFENQALGMSMEYGLRTSLFGISRRLNQLIESKTIGESKIYQRIILVDSDGQFLADHRFLDPETDSGNNWKDLLTPYRSEPTILDIRSKILISIPYFFKNKYAGQIIAWIAPQGVYDHLIKADESRKQFVGIVSGKYNFYSAEDFPLEILYNGLSDLKTLKEGQLLTFQVPDQNQDQIEMIAIKKAVNSTPFSVISFLPASDVYGQTHPKLLLLIMASLALVFLGGLIFIWRMKAHKLVLQTKLEETAKKEREISEKNIDLNREILQRSKIEKKLEKSIETANAANKAKSEFLANMSHELRTPLNHVIGFTELVLDKTFGELNNAQEEYLTDVHASSKHLLSLINDILDLSKVEAGKLELKSLEVNIRDLLESSLVMIKEKALKHGIKITTDLDGIPEYLKVDERKVKQILYNLLSNAVKFTPEGGSIFLTAKRVYSTDEQVQNLPNSATDYIQVSVDDSGIGLRKEDLERIFEPFEQVDNSASRRFQGTGLGLSLTERLVELHGGKIWAESKGEGRGATFRFTLPVGDSV